MGLLSNTLTSFGLGKAASMLGSKLNPKATTAAQTAAAYKPILTKDSAIRPPSDVPAVEGYGGANVMAVPEIRSSGVSTGTLLKPTPAPARPPVSAPLPSVSSPPKPSMTSAGGGYVSSDPATQAKIQAMTGGTINAPTSITNASSNPSAPTISTRPPTTPTASSAPTAPTTSTTIASSPANSQLEALRKSLLSSYQETPDEKAAREAYDAIIAQQANLAASEEMGLAGISNQPIELGLIRGQQEALQKQAVAQQRGLSAQAMPLEQRLAGIQAQREQQRKMAEAELGFATKDMEGEKPIEVGGNLVRLNPQTGQYEVAYKGADKASEGFTLGEGQARYDAQGNLVASGGEKTTTQPATVQEYQFAKSQGYNGSFLDYQKAKDQAAGGGMGSLPSSYKEWQLAGQPGTYADWITKTTGKPPTADQSKAATFAARMDTSNDVISRLENQFTGLTSQLGVVPEAFKSEDRKLMEQAQRDFINSVLRRESGAAISPTEFDSARQQYFPQPGDTKAVLDQKKQNRNIAIEGIQREAGSAEFTPTGVQQSGNQPSIQSLRQQYPQLGEYSDAALMEWAGFPTP